MDNQLRRGIESLRHHYIKKLVKSGLYDESDHELCSLTLNELENIVKHTFPLKKDVSTFQK